MRRLGVTLVVLGALAAGGVIALVAWGNSEFTECYALFRAESDAEAVGDDLRAAAPDLGIHLDSERRDGEVATTFGTGASGAEAQPLIDAFRPAVRAHDGEVGHPGTGCLERGPLM